MVRLLTRSLALLCSVTVVPGFVVQQRYQTIRQAAAETTTTTICMAKMKFTIKENLVGSISSDGLFEGRETIERPQSNKLGVSSKLKKKPKSSSSSSSSSSSTNEQQQQPLSKKERQRTGNGNVDSTLSTRIAAPEQEAIQVVEAKRGAKSVTIVRWVHVHIRGRYVVSRFILMMIADFTLVLSKVAWRRPWRHGKKF